MSTFDITPSAGRHELCYLCHAEIGNYPTLSAFAHTTAGKTHYVHLMCFNNWVHVCDIPGATITCVCNTPIPQDRWNAFTNVFNNTVANPMETSSLHNQLITVVSNGDIEAIRQLAQGGCMIIEHRMGALNMAPAATHPEIIPLLLQNVRIPKEYSSDLAALLTNVVYYRALSNPDNVLAALSAILATGQIDERKRDRLIELIINCKYYEIIPKLLPQCPISDIAIWKSIFKCLNTADEETLKAFFKITPLSFESFKEAVKSIEKRLSIN